MEYSIKTCRHGIEHQDCHSYIYRHRHPLDERGREREKREGTREGKEREDERGRRAERTREGEGGACTREASFSCTREAPFSFSLFRPLDERERRACERECE